MFPGLNISERHIPGVTRIAAERFVNGTSNVTNDAVSDQL